MKARFLEKLIKHMDRIDPAGLENQFLRLAREQGLMETVFQAIREGIIVLDGESRLCYANQAAEHMIGFDFDQAAGDPLQKYIKEIEWDRIKDFDETAWGRLLRKEIEITYPEHRFVEFYVVPLLQEDDQAPHEGRLVIILRDVTREREQVVHTVESERLNAITLLAASVAHEIGNPLNSINIQLQLLERELQDPEVPREELTELVEVARGEINRLDQIITRFLGAIRPTVPERKLGDLTEVIEDMLRVLHQEIKDRGIWVEWEKPTTLPPVLFDPGQLKQAVFNILQNAIQVLGDKGVIHIRFIEDDRHVGIAFSDNGPGMDAETLSLLFQPYQTSKPKGNGLGLLIVQRILRDHGGLIDIDTQPEKGTCITLLLPREDQRIRLLESTHHA